ncbi:MAG TPA: GAF domain-containing sensor histidine kinase [Ktedonobacteraceae bacterium]|nr:GAF domain-containing sensor histidine kinase [Ktedonobacteraceae bacterium]
MSNKNSFWRAGAQSPLRQWRSTPTYFFLVWRWGTWIYALIWFFTLSNPLPNILPTLRICLVITFIQALIVTLYAPVSRILLTHFPSRRTRAARHKEQNPIRNLRRARWRNRQVAAIDEEARIIGPLVNTRNIYWNISIYILDVIICGLITYFSAVNSYPPFGDGSPFYRYGLSAVLVAGFTYSYGGGLLAALGYSLFIIFGAFFHPPGQINFYSVLQNPQDLVGSLIDAPLIALLAAYLANQLNKAILSKRQVQENARREQALRGVSEMMVMGISDQVQLLRQSVRAIRQGGHFEKLVIALVRHDKGQEPRPDFDTYVEADVSDENHPDVSQELVSLVAKTGRQHMSFDSLSPTLDDSGYGIARLYQPFFKDNQVYLVIGAERTRLTPFDQRHEKFLATVGPQLIVALENIRLTAETAALATMAERGRIAREIHDGIAQLLYMLSLNSETCLELLERMPAAADNGNSTLAPLKHYLEKQVTISKQALWETRHYMFTLQPLISGDTTLTQMLTTQLHEFETISGLPARLEVEGQEETLNDDARRNQRRVQMGTAIFRITQEALTNVYKHAQASALEVRLCHQPDCVTIEVRDNGKGMPPVSDGTDTDRLYSGRGLLGMRERAEELGGSFEIRPNPAGGTRVIVSIPFQG